MAMVLAAVALRIFCFMIPGSALQGSGSGKSDSSGKGGWSSGKGGSSSNYSPPPVALEEVSPGGGRDDDGNGDGGDCFNGSGVRLLQGRPRWLVLPPGQAPGVRRHGRTGRLDLDGGPGGLLRD